jgi:hypothetical protein
MDTTKPLEELMQELPPDMVAEIRDFVEFLLSKRGRRASETLRQDWAGALREHQQQYTSLELQQRASEWRGERFSSGAMDTMERKMEEQTRSIEEMVQLLPVEIQDQVRDFIEFLLEKRSRKPEAKLKLDWRGALRDLREQYTAVELQHKVAKWWED